MAEKERIKWQQRYREKAQDMPRAPLILKEYLNQLAAGKVLDVASGDGACALYLAQQKNYEVQATDISSEAMLRLNNFASYLGVSVDTSAGDLDDDDFVASLGSFDGMTINYFKPSAAQWQALLNILKPGGWLMINTFNLEQHHRFGFNSRFCLAPNELKTLDPRLDLTLYQSSVSAPFTDSYIFRKI